jgi:hypothetical protein
MPNQFLQLPEIHDAAGRLVKPILILRDGQEGFSVLVQDDLGEWEFEIEGLVKTTLAGDDLDLDVDGDESRSMTIPLAEVLKLTKFIFEGWRHHGLLFDVRVEWDFLLPQPSVTPSGKPTTALRQ